ncbi:hypothetical protein BQ8794_140180 [Mesorhizobium prunaredense]|uniref:Uncharacterized protein n=1 Tax=Mesorhizobium prunaredense TaxID=1631249 RepID=A0A1R3V6P2_9HYPH|nr:hypothetical protein BQ8794_140180 [Mesorhizobium prunaredense]
MGGDRPRRGLCPCRTSVHNAEPYRAGLSVQELGVDDRPAMSSIDAGITGGIEAAAFGPRHDWP